MMWRKKVLFLISAFLLTTMLLSWVSSAGAQITSGTIAGTVYLDVDANGACVGTGEPIVPGVTIEFVTSDGFTRVDRVTDGAGNYQLVAAGLGTWYVTVKPGYGWLATSQGVRAVAVSEPNQLVGGVDFCVIQVEGESGGSGGVLLPESGAPVAPSLLLFGTIGAVFLLLGAVLLRRARHAA